MVIHAITPTRGDRPILLEQSKLYLSRQTIKPSMHHIIDFVPTDNQKDITKRFRIGLTNAFNEGADLVFLWEDDDWYHPEYIQQMFEFWINSDKPNCIGIADTYYYHLGLKRWMYMRHPDRASAFCTAVTSAVLNMKWPDDTYPFFDIELWKQLNGKTLFTTQQLALGIKGHKEGELFGGNGHNDKWIAYNKNDSDMLWFKNIVKDDFLFYKKY